MPDNLPSLLPTNATDTELALEGATARIGELSVPIKDLWNPEHCPAPLLPWLAWALSVDVWHSEWREAEQRQVIAESIQVHKAKGTRSAIERALSALAIRVDLLEWWENGGQPYTFELTARASLAFDDGDSLIDRHFYSMVRQMIDSIKPARSGYQLKVGVDYGTGMSIASAFSVATHSCNLILLEQPLQNREIDTFIASVASPLQFSSISLIA